MSGAPEAARAPPGLSLEHERSADVLGPGRRELVLRALLVLGRDVDVLVAAGKNVLGVGDALALRALGDLDRFGIEAGARSA